LRVCVVDAGMVERLLRGVRGGRLTVGIARWGGGA